MRIGRGESDRNQTVRPGGWRHIESKVGSSIEVALRGRILVRNRVPRQERVETYPEPEGWAVNVAPIPVDQVVELWLRLSQTG